MPQTWWESTWASHVARLHVHGINQSLRLCGDRGFQTLLPCARRKTLLVSHTCASITRCVWTVPISFTNSVSKLICIALAKTLLSALKILLTVGFGLYWRFSLETQMLNIANFGTHWLRYSSMRVAMGLRGGSILVGFPLPVCTLL